MNRAQEAAHPQLRLRQTQGPGGRDTGSVSQTVKTQRIQVYPTEQKDERRAYRGGQRSSSETRPQGSRLSSNLRHLVDVRCWDHDLKRLEDSEPHPTPCCLRDNEFHKPPWGFGDSPARLFLL